MTARSQQRDRGPTSFSLDPDLLARLAEEENLDPLVPLSPAVERLAIDHRACSPSVAPRQRLQGLQVFCEHRDPRALPLLLPLLQRPCPVERMSAVYSLGRNPSPPAVEPLLQLLQVDQQCLRPKSSGLEPGELSRRADPEPPNPCVANRCCSGSVVVPWFLG